MKDFKFILSQLLDIFGDNLVSVVLFGSYTRKNYNENSDIDLILILNNYTKQDFAELRKRYLLKYEKRLDIQIFSKKDAIQNFRNRSPLFISLILGKNILFDRGMFFKRLFEKFVKEMINEKIKYCEDGKIWRINRIAKNLEILQ